MASIIGAATTPPTQEAMFLMKLFRATPAEERLGINSVNIVVDMLKINIDPTPKKKLATIYTQAKSDDIIVYSFAWNSP